MTPQALAAFPNFTEASKAVLQLLYERLPFGLWMMTRVESTDWIVLCANDHGYGVNDGALFNWSDSFCSRMVRGEGPSFAPVATEIPAYCEAPIGQAVPIGAYIGLPIQTANGSLFGTLCAIDPKPQSEKIRDAEPYVSMLAQLLSTILSVEVSNIGNRRYAFHFAMEPHRDPASRTMPGNVWHDFLAFEEGISSQYGCPGAVAVFRTGTEEARASLIQTLRLTSVPEEVHASTGDTELSVLIPAYDRAPVEARLAELAVIAERTPNCGYASKYRHSSHGYASAWESAQATAGYRLEDAA